MMISSFRVGRRGLSLLGVAILAALVAVAIPLSGRLSATPQAPATAPDSAYLLHDSHLHLTNYVQEGPDIHDFLKVMGTKVGRVALFGLPLQQMWDKHNTGDFAPTYYLQSDAPLYYYSFTDAYIAMQHRSLTPAEQARFDPMITGFNPADMYAADHIKRVLLTFPGVFSGIGEFTIHKEFVSAKIPGKTASLLDPALDRLLDFAGEADLIAIFHNDIDMPFPKPGQEPWIVPQFRDMLLRHPTTNIIWAHAGVGRIVHPVTPILGKPIPILGTVIFLDHTWNDTWSTTVGYSQTDIDNTEGQAPNAYKKGQYALFNLLYTPVPSVMMGGEFQWGRRTNFSDGFHSDGVKVQFPSSTISRIQSEAEHDGTEDDSHRTRHVRHGAGPGLRALGVGAVAGAG